MLPGTITMGGQRCQPQQGTRTLYRTLGQATVTAILEEMLPTPLYPCHCLLHNLVILSLMVFPVGAHVRYLAVSSPGGFKDNPESYC